MKTKLTLSILLSLSSFCLFSQSLDSRNLSEDSLIVHAIKESIKKSFLAELQLEPIDRTKNSPVDSRYADKDLKEFNFVGGGDLNSIGQSSGNAKAGNISLGLYMLREYPENSFLKDLEIDFALNVASTVDSFNLDNKKSLGNYILNPINTSQSARLDFYSMFYPKYYKTGKKKGKEKLLSVLIDGGFMRFYASNANWSYKGESVSTTSLQFRAGVFHEFLPDAVARLNNSSVMLGAAYGFRTITGDIRGNNERILEEVTGTTKSTYWGLDIVFSVKFNNIRGEFIIPFVKKYKDVSLAGLTDTQFYTQIRFIGGFPLQLKNSEALEKELKNISN